jgi:hypothetical protein
MKKLIYLAVISFALSCGNEKSDATKTEAPPVSPGIENTDGNIPDSTNSINLNQKLPVDSSGLRDSTPR